MRLSTSRKNIITTDIWFLANITDFKAFLGLMGKDEDLDGRNADPGTLGLGNHPFDAFNK